MLVEVAGLHFRYLGAAALALTDLHLAVGEGEFVAVVGAAGAGKTTLASCLNGTIPHFQDGEWAGTVRLAGRPAGEIPPAVLAQLVGTVSADPDRRFVATTVEEEAAFGLENLCLPPAEIEARLGEALSLTGIAHLRRRATESLSGGEKGRLVLAAVLALRPRLLILDEPTAELDPGGAEQVMAAVAELHRTRGATVILCESRLANAVPYAGRLVLLQRGRLVADGPARRVVADESLLALAGLAAPPVTRAAKELRARGLLRGDELPLILEELERGLSAG